MNANHLNLEGKKVWDTRETIAELLWRMKPQAKSFKSSQDFWSQRYEVDGTSGPGSYGRLANWKASVINEIVKKYSIKDAVEFGCGDGNNLALYEIPYYTGLDVSEKAVERCQTAFGESEKHCFRIYRPKELHSADIGLSIDVIFHLVEKRIFERYMHDLFQSSKRLVLIYSTNYTQTELNVFRPKTHVRRRNFSKFVKRNFCDWRLVEWRANPYPLGVGDKSECSDAEFFLYEKRGDQTSSIHAA